MAVLQFWTSALRLVLRTLIAATSARSATAASFCADGAERDELLQVRSGRDGERRRRSGRDDEEERPSVQERGRAVRTRRAGRRTVRPLRASSRRARRTPARRAARERRRRPRRAARGRRDPPACRSTPPGTRKMPEPITVPITMSVRSRRPRTRARARVLFKADTIPSTMPRLYPSVAAIGRARAAAIDAPHQPDRSNDAHSAIVG